MTIRLQLNDAGCLWAGTDQTEGAGGMLEEYLSPLPVGEIR